MLVLYLHAAESRRHCLRTLKGFFVPWTFSRKIYTHTFTHLEQFGVQSFPKNTLEHLETCYKKTLLGECRTMSVFPHETSKKHENK